MNLQITNVKHPLEKKNDMALSGRCFKIVILYEKSVRRDCLINTKYLRISDGAATNRLFREVSSIPNPQKK